MTHKRVLLKLSGEALMGSQSFGLNPEICRRLASEIKDLHEKKVELGLVVGAGNIFRGVKGAAQGMQRIPSDQVGMLGTLINGLILSQALHAVHCPVKVLSALPCESIVELYDWKKAVEYLKSGFVVIMVGGLGLPYFTTDTAAALRGVEIGAELLLKATKVDGVYDKDPACHPGAKRYAQLSISQMLAQNLGVMDATAAALCREHRLPVLVFDIFTEKALSKALFSEKIGSLILPE